MNPVLLTRGILERQRIQHIIRFYPTYKTIQLMAKKEITPEQVVEDFKKLPLEDKVVAIGVMEDDLRETQKTLENALGILTSRKRIGNKDQEYLK